jgi:GNAT superfamily N-acetyltransferase
MQLQTVPFNSSHKKGNFQCGVVLLDNYLHTQAKQDVIRKLSACFILADENNKMLGYYTLSSASIPCSILTDAIQKKLPSSYSDLPCTLLGRLAVDQKYQGKGNGELLLVDALKRSFDTSSIVGSMAIVVDPIDDKAVKFYRAFGFLHLPDSGKMFLPMATIAELF